MWNPAREKRCMYMVSLQMESAKQMQFNIVSGHDCVKRACGTYWPRDGILYDPTSCACATSCERLISSEANAKGPIALDEPSSHISQARSETHNNGTFGTVSNNFAPES
jgi:hypothetical protein